MREIKMHDMQTTRSGNRFSRFSKLRLLSLTLCVLMLLSVTPPVHAADSVDFQALVQSGGREGYTVQVTLEPKSYIRILSGGDYGMPYFVYQDLKNYQQGITDAYGTVRYLDTAYNDLKLCSDNLIWIGMDDGGWLCNFQGNRVFQEKVKPGEVSALVDKSTGKACGAAIGRAYDNPLEGYYQKTIVTADGWSLTALKISEPRNRIVVYLDAGSEKWGAIRLGGKEVLPCEYDQLSFAGNAFLIAKQGDLYSLRDDKGELVLDLPYEEVRRAGDASLLVKENGLWGSIDFTGKVIVPIVYDSLTYNAESSLQYQGSRAGTNYAISESETVTFCGSREFPAESAIVMDNLYLVPREGGANSLVNGENEKLIPEPISYCRLLGDTLAVWLYDENAVCIYDLTEEPQLLKKLEGDGWTRIGQSRLARTTFGETGSSQVWIYDNRGNKIAVLENAQLYAGGEACMVLQNSGKYAFSDLNGALLTDYEFDLAQEVSSGTETLRYPLFRAEKEGKTYLFDGRNADFALPVQFTTSYTVAVMSAGKFFPIYDQEGRVGFAHFTKPGECPFTDTKDSAWYAKSVIFCANAGLLKGTGNGKFEPNTPMTRAMLVQVLYNINGEKTPSYGFTDVPSGKWYTKAVNWAANKGYVKGTGPNTFSPNAEVSREQMVTILYRYAQSFGAAYEGGTAPLEPFQDRGQVSKFARQAMAWAVSTGLITGTTSTTLNPQGSATRAEISVVLTRFIRLMAES